MTQVIRLKARPDRTIHPQCCAKPDIIKRPRNRLWTGTHEARFAGGYNPDLCTRHASVTIDAKPYCMQHGALIAFNILETQGRAKQHADV